MFGQKKPKMVSTKIKATLISEPVLIAPDFQKQFKMAIDTIDIECGGVLVQDGEDGVDHPAVSCFSQKFAKHQRNYSTIEKECFALILALEHFDVYLDNQRLVRSLTLQGYTLDIRNIEGKDNVMADALSRVA